jgi:hypothetical protein
MTFSPDIPEYLSCIPAHSAETMLNISWDCYRLLAHTTLKIINELDTINGLYRLPQNRGAALNIFTSEKCISIVIDSESSEVSLHSCLLDSVKGECLAVCDLVEEESWRELAAIARNQIKSDA